MCHAVPNWPHSTATTKWLTPFLIDGIRLNRPRETCQVWEVVKVDPAVGGSVVLKGGVNNLTETERSETWSQFGLSLLGNATLM